jgi:putative redox protein
LANTAKLTLLTVDDGLRFHIAVGSGQQMMYDSGPGMLAPSPVEGFLAAIGGCCAMDVISILRKKRMRVTGYTVEMSGERLPDHPRRFTEIQVMHRVRGYDLTIKPIEEAIHLSETRYCSVRAALIPEVQVHNRVEIVTETGSVEPEVEIGPPSAPRQGLSELILRVADVERSLAFYRDVVGLEVERQDSPQWAWLWSGRAGALPRIGLTSKPLSFGAAHCGGPAHFAIAVPRSAIPAEKSRLEALGLAVEGPVTFESWQADSIYFDDPDRHRVELCGFARLEPQEAS